MKKILCVLLCLSAISGTIFAQTLDEAVIASTQIQLVDFDDDPPPPPPAEPKPKEKGSRKINTPKRNPPPPPEHHVDTVGDVIFDTLFALSLVNNLIVEFDNYPYANGDYYVEVFDSNGEDFPNRFCRFDVGASCLYDPKNMMLNPYVRLDGYAFKFFGPLFENTNYVDFGDTDFYTGSFKLGMEMAIFQSYFCSLSWNIQWVHYYGNGDLNGLNVGLLVKSYPIKPLVFEYRFNASTIYDNDNHRYGPYQEDVVYEHYVEFGCMLNSPVEVFGCYKYLQDGIMQKRNHTFGVGVKYYF